MKAKIEKAGTAASFLDLSAASTAFASSQDQPCSGTRCIQPRREVGFIPGADKLQCRKSIDLERLWLAALFSQHFVGNSCAIQLNLLWPQCKNGSKPHHH